MAVTTGFALIFALIWLMEGWLVESVEVDDKGTVDTCICAIICREPESLK